MTWPLSNSYAARGRQTAQDFPEDWLVFKYLHKIVDPDPKDFEDFYLSMDFRRMDK